VPVWIALIRGINVGGKNMVPMKTLAADLSDAGCQDVKTYLQSGNVVLKCKAKTAAAVETLVAEAIESRHRFRPSVLCLTAAELAEAVAANPFKAAEADHKTLHVVFLAGAPAAAAISGLAKYKTTDEYEVTGKRMYLHTPDGLLSSKIAERPDKLLGVAATARNWRTVMALQEMAAG
jgi:uncharacterized protein (DUF1697 family)